MSQVDELFSLEELGKLTVPQLKRVMEYLGLTVEPYQRRPKMIDDIMNYQKYSNPVVYGGNPDWKDGVPRSVRIQRIYEAYKAGRKI